MRIAVYPGSFDPVTTGHEDIIFRAAALFDEVIVAVLHNPSKMGCFPVNQRLEMLKKVVATKPNVRVAAWDGMLVDFVRQQGACAVIRGLRQVTDFESEMTMAQVNSHLLPDMETIFLMTRPEQGCISSSIVREVASFGGDISAFVPACISGEVQDYFRK
ncbi:MAG: pantetheine-phosphate adenylyltransferase [Clostridiales bacterium]|nr:pantetheine-phosphate adenylyltransferase [Clostridiales bacterium]